MSTSPLAGVRVLLTRPEGDGADEWAAAFADAGAVAIRYPTIVAGPPASWAELDGALARLDDYDWLIFTSQTAVAFVVGRLPRERLATARSKIAAVGRRTAKAIEAAGGCVGVVPEDQRQEGLLEALSGLPSTTRVLLPMAAGGRTILADGLRGLGCKLDVVAVYETRANPNLPPPPPFDVAVFASPSALRAFVVGAGRASLRSTPVVAIGPTTAAEAKLQGLVPVVAESPSVRDLIRAIADARPAKGDS
jgi:uroporphyrinogen III methyltransferase / synthase